MVGVLELKVLRGPVNADYKIATEGLAQGYYYRRDLELPFATLALYDVNNPPTHDTGPLIQDQDSDHVAIVRVKRYPIYNSPQAWRNGGGYEAAA
jgi:hypothetical protein